MTSQTDNIVYGLEAWPPFFKLLGLALQQVLTICVPLVLVPIILSEGDISHEMIVSVTSYAMIGMGLGAILQGLWFGPVGSGFLAPPLLSAIYLNASILAIKEGGLPCLMTMTLFAGFFEILISRFIKQLRYLFTPPVIGLIVFIVGFILGIKGFEKVLDIVEPSAANFKPHLLVALITLFSIFGLCIWAKGILKLLCVFVGILIGAIFAALLGLFDPTLVHVYQNMPYVFLPSHPPFHFDFEPSLIVPFAICAVVAALRAMGTIISSQQLNDSNWSHPDYASIKKGVLADGLGAAIAGMMGSSGISASPSSVGVAKMTGATSRVIGFAVSILLILFAFSPKISGLFLILPTSLAGVALLVNGSFMMLAGIQIITLKPIDVRTIFMIGIALAAGTTRIFMHEYYENLTGIWLVLSSSVLSVTTLTALFITLVSRIQIKQHQIIDQQSGIATQIKLDELLGRQFEKWSVPKGIKIRATECCHSVLKSLVAMGVSSEQVQLDMSYDQIVLQLSFRYKGDIPPMMLSNLADGYDLVEEQAFHVGLMRMLSGVFPDQHQFSSDNGQSLLVFTFDC